MIRIGINGFGRIGRAIFRNNIEKSFFKIVAINDINPDSKNIAYTLNYDTLYDRIKEPFWIEGEFMVNSSEKIRISHEKAIDDVNWREMGVDFVIDASGVYKNVLASRNLIEKGEVKKVFITHSPEDVDFTIILGVNQDEFDLKRHHVISTSICDATAIAPVMKAIYHAFGIEFGYVTTLHPWLSYQNLLDGPASSWSFPGEIYHHFALGRSVFGNMIPKPTSAISATCKVLKKEGITEEMIGSFSYRTPTAIVGSADITLKLTKLTSKQEVISLFEHFEQDQMWKIFHNNWEPLVSLDFKKSDFSAIIDHRWTDLVGRKLLKLVLWYDNEWGYSARVLDQIKYVDSMLKYSK